LRPSLKEVGLSLRESVRHDPFWIATASTSTGEAEVAPEPAVLERIKASLAKHGDTTSRFDKLKRSAAGSMYIFRVDEERRCPYGADHSGSNNFAVLVRDRALLYHCSSGECSEVRPMRQIGKLTRFESMLGGETAPVAPDDLSVCRTLDKRFVDYWAFQGDMGGSHIVDQMYASCGR
jgi:hypothetical protein